MSRAVRPGRARDRVLGAALFVLLAAVYLASPVRILTDSRYALLVSHALGTAGSWDLSPWVLRPDGELPRSGRGRATPWQLVWHDGEVRYFYPVGTSLAAVPVVAVLAPSGRSVVGPHGRWAEWREIRLQGRLAALVAAATVWLVYRIARRELAAGGAAAVAVAAGLGSSLWSVCSRLLFAHTLEALLAAWVLLELLRWADGERRRPVLLGALLVAGFWVRPTFALVALAVVALVALRHRAALTPLVATGLAGLALFVAISWATWRAPLPPYYLLGTGVTARGFLGAAWGLVASPSRGFLVYHPALLLAAGALAWRGIPDGRRALVAWAGAVAVGHLALYASWSFWWGGGGYGPRLLAGMVPVVAWLGALAARALGAPASAAGGVAPPGPGARRVALVAAAVVVAASVWVHGLGACAPRVAKRAHEVGADLGRPAGLWNWRRHPAWRPLADAFGLEEKPVPRDRGPRRPPRRAPGEDRAP